MSFRKLRSLGFITIAALFVAACDNDDDVVAPPAPPPPPPPPAMANFEVTVTNLTNAQPLSPIAVIGHQDGYRVFTIGTAATLGLEELAEGGSNAALIAEADADANVVVTASGAGPIGPAGSETISFEILESDLAGLTVSTSTMLVNTKDAFTGASGVDVSGFAAGDSVTLTTIAYDAGTEADDELALNIPGPAAGGEGFNAARDDSADRVTMHSGVIGADDGFATSDLDNQHRFDNPVSRVRIERVN